MSILPLAAFALLLVSSAAGAADRTISLPCIPDDSTQPKTPAEVGLRKCSALIAEVKGSAEKTIQGQVDQLYNGCDFDPKAPKPAAKGACQGRPSSTEVCNMFPGTFNRQISEGLPGSDNNHLGNSCGKWALFETRLDGANCTVTPNHTGEYYHREDSFTRGAWIQALNCHFEQVKNEITRRELKLTGVGAAEGPCAEMAKDFDARKRASDAVSKDLQSQLSLQKNVSDIENCSESAVSTVKGSPDLGRLRQSACQLVSARTFIESMYTYLAVCEVYARAERSYQSFQAGIGQQKTFYDSIQVDLNGCIGQQRGAASCNSDAIFNECYYPKFVQFFKDKASKVWSEEVCR